MALVGLMQGAGLPVRHQVGEPWWWVMQDRRICIYDDAAKAAFGGNPVSIPDLGGSLNAAQKALLDQAGALLAKSTADLAAAVKAAAGATVRAGFLFDVPVRFGEDRLDISGAEFAAGEAPSVPLVELREDA